MGSSKSKPQAQRRASTRRAGISAGAVDFDALATFVPKVIEKSTEEMELLKTTLENEMLFSHLDAKELQTLLSAMYGKDYKGGEDIIKQGDEDGEEFFVMANGQVDVIINDETVKTLTKGSFGELALIYGTARAATIRATTDMKCFAMDRDTYRAILMGATIKKRELYDSVLSKVELLAECDSWERSQVADALESIEAADGEVIIKQGDSGTDFFIIMDGTCIVTQTNDAGETGQVAELGTSKYFGEIALLKNEPRAATVTSKGVSKLAKLDKERFERVLGPVTEILKRNMAHYEKFTDRKSVV